MDVIITEYSEDGNSQYLVSGIQREDIPRLEAVCCDTGYGVLCYAEKIEGWTPATPSKFADDLIAEAVGNERLFEKRNKFMHEQMCELAKRKRTVAEFMRSIGNRGIPVGTRVLVAEEGRCTTGKVGRVIANHYLDDGEVHDNLVQLDGDEWPTPMTYPDEALQVLGEQGVPMMEQRKFGGGWNYRVMRTKDGDEDTLCLVEAYYNDKGEVDAVAIQDIPCEVSIDLLRKNFERMLGALDKPIIDEVK
jgi:hypothetical protein